MEDDDPERLAIREKISNMSFEELVNLKKKLGGQAYNEAVFGIKKKPCVQKRLNKNRPTEMSSKVRSNANTRNPSTLSSSSTPMARDPRFDHLCGEFNDQRFKEDYSFITDIKHKEKEQLKKQLKKEKDPHRKEKIRFLVSRMTNQEREEQKLAKQREKKKQELEERIQMLNEGKRPHFLKKSEKRVLDLVEQYEDLKKKGRVEKVLEKYRKKQKKRDGKQLPSDYK